MTENYDISVVFSTLLGSEAVVVTGVLGLVADLLSVACTDCETVPFVVVVGKPQVCFAKGRLIKFKKKVLFSINGLF